MIIELPHRFKPRDYQADILRALFVQGYRHIYLVAHRRSGKDKLCINILTAAACRRVGTYLYLFPQSNQARKVVWKGLDGSGMRFLDHIPACLIAKSNGTEMTVELINGSIIQLAGSNNFDSLMGTNPVGIVYSEFPLHNPMARQYLNPILAENGGFEILQGTPRGRNHAYKVWQSTFGDKAWYAKSLGVNDTKREDGSPVVSQEEIDDFRRSGMSEELIRQEFYVDWNIGVQGAYYTGEMDLVEKEGRIGSFPVRSNTPVWTFWDLGISDATSIWFVQPNGHYLDLVYYYESTGKGIEHYIDIINAFKHKHRINYSSHYAPHDIAQREWSSARSRISVARDMGIHFQVVRKASIEDGIQALKSLFYKLRFDIKGCAQGITCLREYKRMYDEVNRCYRDKPVHDWTSHCFSGNTLVLTRHGMCRIMDLPETGEVLTLCGWKPYTNPRITKKNAPLVEVQFSDGLTVKCTPDHMFLTVSGWKSAEFLMPNTEIQSSLMSLPNISMDTFTEYGLVKITSQKEGLHFIEKCGKLPLVQFLKGVISTIKMGLSQIIDWKIWSAWMRLSIYQFLGINIPESLPLNNVEIRQKIGIPLRLEDFGIADMRLDQKIGRNGSEQKSCVNSAIKSLTPSIDAMDGSKSSVMPIAKRLHIESVRKISDCEDVWCLTVPGVEHFSLSNGAVVHNCADAARYMGLIWTDLFTRPDQASPFPYQIEMLGGHQPFERSSNSPDTIKL